MIRTGGQPEFHNETTYQNKTDNREKRKNVLAVKLKTGFKISKNMSIKSGALGPCGAKYLN